MEQKSKMTEQHNEKVWRVWQLGQADEKYRRMLEEIRVLERVYDQVLQNLPDEQRDIVCDYVSACEAMSWRMLEIACGQIRFQDP